MTRFVAFRFLLCAALGVGPSTVAISDVPSVTTADDLTALLEQFDLAGEPAIVHLPGRPRAVFPAGGRAPRDKASGGQPSWILPMVRPCVRTGRNLLC